MFARPVPLPLDITESCVPRYLVSFSFNTLHRVQPNFTSTTTAHSTIGEQGNDLVLCSFWATLKSQSQTNKGKKLAQAEGLLNPVPADAPARYMANFLLFPFPRLYPPLIVIDVLHPTIPTNVPRPYAYHPLTCAHHSIPVSSEASLSQPTLRRYPVIDIVDIIAHVSNFSSKVPRIV